MDISSKFLVIHVFLERRSDHKPISVLEVEFLTPWPTTAEAILLTKENLHCVHVGSDPESSDRVAVQPRASLEQNCMCSFGAGLCIQMHVYLILQIKFKSCSLLILNLNLFKQ